MRRIVLSFLAGVAFAGVIAATAPRNGGSGQSDQAAAVQTSSDLPASAVPSAREIRGATPYFPVENEPPPRLIVDPPLTTLLDKGIVWIQYRTENCRICPVFGKAALDVSPRIGHLHVHVDDLPWLWADASDMNTIDLANMPPGEHKVLIELADANHEVFPGQSRTVKFTVPNSDSPPR